MEISLDESAFALLVDSYAIACRSLNGLAIAAVKAGRPAEWKERICACFSNRTKQHVKDDLEAEDARLTDIFAVCKVMRCRLDDVSRYIGGERHADPREKERLSLNIQAVEACRHWMFHGEFVSLREAHESVRTLISILTTVGCRLEFSRLLKSQLAKIENLLREERHGESLMRVNVPTVLQTLLYRSLGESEKEFSAYLKRQQDKRSESCGQSAMENTAKKSFHDLIKAILGDLCRPKKGQKGTKQPSMPGKIAQSCRQLCPKIEAIRNKFAHGKQLMKDEVILALEGIAELLKAFQLTHEGTKSALKFITGLAGRALDVACVVRKQQQNKQHASNQKRIPRAKVDHFVGRKQEVSCAMEALTSHSLDGTKRMVMLFGTTGIGKSYLANKLAYDLRAVYPKQHWVCCSTEQEMISSDSIVFSIRCEIENEQPITAGCDGMQSMGEDHCPQAASTNYAADELFVFDDVTLATMHVVLEKVLVQRHSFVMTTRSSSVKDFLQQKLASLLVIKLHQFSNNEVAELLRLRTRAKGNEHSVTNAWQKAHVLANLPLCVSIIASLVVACSRNKTCTMLYDSIDSSLSSTSWREIEDEFGDRFHVRGLSGMLEVAKTELCDRPLVLFALAKIVSADIETVPWHLMMIKTPLSVWPWTYQLLQPQETILKGLLVELSGVADWLFSAKAEKELKLCCDILEELGLISWDEEESSVYIHRLILRGVQAMLLKNKLPELLSVVSRQPRHSPQVQQAADKLCASFQMFLWCQLIFTSTESLLCLPSLREFEVLSLSDMQLEAQEFLAGLLDGDCLLQLIQMPMFGLAHLIVLLIVRSLVAFVS